MKAICLTPGCGLTMRWRSHRPAPKVCPNCGQDSTAIKKKLDQERSS